MDEQLPTLATVLGQVLCLHRRRSDQHTRAVSTDETVYATTSLTPEQARPADLLRLWCTHWTIENDLQWVRDVVFAEDASTLHAAHAPQALAARRNLALSFLHRWRHRHITAARQFYASHPTTLFRRLRATPVRLCISPSAPGAAGCTHPS